MQVNYKQFNTNRRFGVELEVGNEIRKAQIKRAILKHSDFPVVCSGWATSKNNAFWHIKNDATCGKDGWEGNRGFEIASYVASGWRQLLQIEQCVRSVQKLGVKTNKNCGLHVHVDVTDFSTFEMASLVAHWLKIELRMLHSVPRRRASFDGYSKPIMHSTCFYIERNRSYSPGEFWEMFVPEDGEPYVVDRAVTLNIQNYLKLLKWPAWLKGTVEFRWPEGTLNSVDVKNWIRLFVNFVENSKDRPMPEDICHSDLDETLDILGLGHPDGLTVLSPGLHETKTWFLERIIKHYDEYPYLERKKQTDRAKEILNDMWVPLRKY